MSRTLTMSRHHRLRRLRASAPSSLRAHRCRHLSRSRPIPPTATIRRRRRRHEALVLLLEARLRDHHHQPSPRAATRAQSRSNSASSTSFKGRSASLAAEVLAMGVRAMGVGAVGAAAVGAAAAGVAAVSKPGSPPFSTAAPAAELPRAVRRARAAGTHLPLPPFPHILHPVSPICQKLILFFSFFGFFLLIASAAPDSSSHIYVTLFSPYDVTADVACTPPDSNPPIPLSPFERAAPRRIPSSECVARRATCGER